MWNNIELENQLKKLRRENEKLKNELNNVISSFEELTVQNKLLKEDVHEKFILLYSLINSRELVKITVSESQINEISIKNGSSNSSSSVE